ncbi:MAG: alpha/beta hydrolase [Deltaproteobacteria bacterium]|nr:alpha/beta hydrolase [Deltaproteobacteria bacterium]
MPAIRVNGTDLYYRDMGKGDEVVVFSHGLLLDNHVFDRQIEVLGSHYRCIAWDHRGQGRSAVPDEHAILIDTLYADAVCFLEALGVGPVHFVGQSLGGWVGIRLAARRPDLVRSLVLMATAMDPEPRGNRRRYRAMSFVARYFGPRWVTSQVMPVLFGHTFLDDPNRARERERWRDDIASLESNIYKAVNGAITSEPVHAELAAIEVPTLVLCGEEDQAVPPLRSEALHAALPDSRMVRIPAAGHSATIEQPEAVNAALKAFLTRVAREETPFPVRSDGLQPPAPGQSVM